MTRIGINPARGKTSSYRPARVTVAVLVYIPHLAGYFARRLDVLRITLSSILHNTRVPFDVLVFDNGSCREVVDFLRSMRDAGKVDYLLLSSRNLGKIGAFQLLFRAAPGEIIAYTDDDVMFYPGWLEAHLKILETYPRVGMVSGSPVRDNSRRASETLQQFIQSGDSALTVSHEQRIPEEWERDWAESTGRDPDQHLQSYQDYFDIILSYNKVEAFGSASHFQFLSPKRVIEQALPEDWSGYLMGRMIELDERIDQLGLLRLSTPHRFTQHIGNTVSSKLLEQIQSFHLDIQRENQTAPGREHWLLKIPGSGRLFKKIYHYLFRVLYGGS